MNVEIRETDAEGKAGPAVPGPELKPDTFYRFDAEAVCSLSHAIEDVALDEANGTLLSAFQDFKNFETHRERYCQLAATIDRVQVLAAGRRPKPARRIKFLREVKARLKSFWMVLYAGRNKRALLFCQEVKGARDWDDKKFFGFYTFDPKVIARVTLEVSDLLADRAKAMREFQRLHGIDRAAKELNAQFTRERTAATAAIRKLQKGKNYRTRHFLADVEKSLARLEHWKTGLPLLLGEA